MLAENVRNKVLEPHHYWQLEHQSLTAEVEEIHFMVSDGTIDKRVSMVYRSVPERREALIAGWKQFEIDLENHVLEAKTEAVTARKQEGFPVIDCRVEGSRVVSNLGNYISLVQDLADKQMSIVLESDQDFADKEAFNKKVKEGRASLKLKAGEIETAFESLAEFNGYVKQADTILQKLQSHGEKQVKEAKEYKKQSILSNAYTEIDQHLIELGGTINGTRIQLTKTDWSAVIKGKRSFEKMQDAVDAEIAKLKIKSNEMAREIRKNLDSLTELDSDHQFLFSDHAELILKENIDLVNLIKARISEHKEVEKKRLEKEREKIREEEAAKVKADADAEKERQRLADKRAQAGPEKTEKLKAEIEPEKPIIEKAVEAKPTSRMMHRKPEPEQSKAQQVQPRNADLEHRNKIYDEIVDDICRYTKITCADAQSLVGHMSAGDHIRHTEIKY